MKKKRNILLLGLAVVAIAIVCTAIGTRGNTINTVNDSSQSKSSLSSKSIIAKEDISNPSKAAKKLNAVKDESEFENGVRDVLDDYYSNDRDIKIQQFSNKIDKRAKTILSNYQAASSEREEAKKLDYVTGELCVAVDKNMTAEDMKELAEKYRGELKEVIPLDEQDNLAVISTSLEYTVNKAADVYENADSRVSYAEADGLCQVPDDDISKASLSSITSKAKTSSTNVSTNDKYYSAQSNYLNNINTLAAWETQKSVTTSKIKVAVIDSGCNVNHPDLKSTINRSYSVRILNGKYKKLTKLKSPDPNGHGTHVCGIIGATGNNGIGVTGVATGGTNSKISIIAISVSNKNGQIRITDAIRAINYAKKKKVKAINMSFTGYDKKTKSMKKALKAAYKKKIFCAAAAGNNNTGKIAAPSDSSYVTSVTATGGNAYEAYGYLFGSLNYNQRAFYSNFGKYKDIAAPGSLIPSTYGKSGYMYASGTSMSCPVVVGTLAMMYSINPKMKVSAARKYLYSTATDLGAKGKDIYYGYGKVNVGAAVFKTTKPKLSIARTGVNSVKLSWTALKGSGTTSYDVYRKAGSGAYSKVRTLSINYMEDTYLNLGTKYTYMVIARNNGTSSQYSTEKSIYMGIGTSNISSLPVSTTTATITWSGATYATNYELYRSTSASGPWNSTTRVATSTSSGSYGDTGLTEGKNYYYRVSAYRFDGGTVVDRTWSPVQMRPVVGAAYIKKLTSSKSVINVYWKAVSGAKSYKIYRATGSSYKLVKTISNGGKSPGTTLKWKNRKLKKNKKYYYRVVVTKNTNGVVGISKTSNTKAIRTKKK